MIRLVFLTLLLTSVFSAAAYTKFNLEDPDAFCLDGSKPAFYYHKGDAHKFILSFEGGGWCGSAASLEATLENCYQRSKTALGSSSSYPPTMSIADGILSDSPNNPFRGWSMVHIKYCDGTGHQGFKKDTIEYKGVKLHFRGHNATQGTLNALNATYKLFSNATTDIMVTGQSAGGLATYLWTNYIHSLASNETKVFAVPDSGIFLDQANYMTRQYNYRGIIINFMKLSNVEVNPPMKECVDINPSAKWSCMFAEHLHQYIKVPQFPIQSLYDSWSLPNILGINCGVAGSFANCTSGQMEVIDKYRQNTSEVLKSIADNFKNGLWAPACSNHVYSTGAAFASANFRVPASSEFSAIYSLEQWYAGVGDHPAHLDTVAWPDNKPCSGVKEQMLAKE